MEDNKQIELRSERVRNIIGQVPPLIIRIAIIFAVVCGMLAGAYFFRFNRTIDAPTKLFADDCKICYSIEVLSSKVRHVETGNKLLISIHNGLRLPTTVQKIDTTLHVNKERSYHIISGQLSCDLALNLDEQIDAKVKIYCGKINLIEYVFGF
ncbi:MAG: hypothetical protein ACK5L5_03455 [Bacteroidales bacterium]